MSQTLSQIPRQAMQQQQRLTPQLIQAMDILQLNSMALESRLAQELDENPALEQTLDRSGEEAPLQESPPEPDRDGQSDADAFERYEQLVEQYDGFEDERAFERSRRGSSAAAGGDDKLEAMANAPARPESLEEHLLRQWTMVDLDDVTRRIGAVIIGWVDADGRLTRSLEQIGAEISPSPSRAQLEQALAAVQLLEPAGVGARDLRECLLLQLEAMEEDTELAQQIVEHHLEDLRKNRIPQIARALNVEIDDVKDALALMQRLSPRPGKDVVDLRVGAVTPDVIVEFVPASDSYAVRLARESRRELRISRQFRVALERARGDRAAREFIKQKIDAAVAIIEAVRYRSERLLEVAEAVVAAQRDFLDHGEQRLKVLRMSDLAARFGCDPSTISRTVDGKWMQTPRGLFPLRRFFTGGTESSAGEELGWDSIKAKVQEIVDGEDKSNPLSDDQIVVRLQRAGIKIKRRTVAKYRAQLHIRPARERREF